LLSRLARYRAELPPGAAPVAAGPGQAALLGTGCVATVYVPEGCPDLAVKQFRVDDVRRLRRELGQCRGLLRLARRLRLLSPFHERVAAELLRQVGRQADPEAEARYHRRFAANFDGQAFVAVPRLHGVRGNEIIMERIGDRVGVDAVAPSERTHVARMIVRILYQMIFTDGLVHGDLHPGNFIVESGRIILLDFGLCWRLDDRERLKFADFFLAFIRCDGPGCAAVALEMAEHVPERLDRAAFAREVQAVLEAHRSETVRDFSLAGFAFALFRVQQARGVVSTTAFLAPIMALLGVEGSLKSLDPDLDFRGEARTFVLNCLAGVQKRRASDNVRFAPAPAPRSAGAVPSVARERLAAG
jgi:ubiquinone biosynthesis protein